MSDEQKYKDMQVYIEKRYGKNYMSAISKLNVEDAFDENGVLKAEYVLSRNEKDAIKRYTGYREKYPTRVSDIEYQKFLNNVRKYTSLVFENNLAEEEELTFDIHGIEYNSSRIMSQYGLDIYLKADLEVPKTKYRLHNMSARDFSKARRKLAFLVGVGRAKGATIGVIDLGILMELFNNAGIPCYIDYERNIFHYKAIEKSKSRKRTINNN